MTGAFSAYKRKIRLATAVSSIGGKWRRFKARSKRWKDEKLAGLEKVKRAALEKKKGLGKGVGRWRDFVWRPREKGGDGEEKKGGKDGAGEAKKGGGGKGV